MFSVASRCRLQCNLQRMILLITSSDFGQNCAKALLASTRLKTEVVPDVRSALNRLREDSFSAVILDESLLDASAKQIDILLKHLGTAVPVFINLGISRTERVVRDVLLALRRVDQERVLARKAVEWELRSQLKGELTGILLWTQQAMSVPSLPAAAESKLKSVYELADRMRSRLEITDSAEKQQAAASNL